VNLRALADGVGECYPVPDRTAVHVDHDVGAEPSLIVQYVGTEAGVVPKYLRKRFRHRLPVDPGALYDEVPPKVRCEVNGRQSKNPQKDASSRG